MRRMLDLWLIRHAESMGNLDGTGSDTDLSSEGQAQGRRLHDCLSPFVFDLVWSSPLLRARQTAALALPGSTPIVDERLTELRSDTGPHYVDMSNPAEVRALLAKPPSPTESGKDFMARVDAWRAELPSSGRVAVFTHFAVLRELLGAFLGFDRAPQEIPFVSIHRLSIGSGAAEYGDAARAIGAG